MREENFSGTFHGNIKVFFVHSLVTWRKGDGHFFPGFQYLEFELHLTRNDGVGVQYCLHLIFNHFFNSKYPCLHTFLFKSMVNLARESDPYFSSLFR
jgi:hypothetical protein